MLQCMHYPKALYRKTEGVVRTFQRASPLALDRNYHQAVLLSRKAAPVRFA